MMHPFEKAGLGYAPFRFVGMTEATYQACSGAPIQPGASCDYCGQGIRYVCIIKSADGREFRVGCDCVRKTTSKGVRVLSDVDRAKRAIDKKNWEDRAQEAREETRATLNSDSALLTSEPHPNEYMAGRGISLRDYVLWQLDRGGKTAWMAARQTVKTACAA